MEVVIVGAGEVGNHLCATLSDAGHHVTLIESNEAQAEKVDEELNVRVIHGNGSLANVLMKAQTNECHYFMAMTQDDKTNVLACSVAKALGAETTIARISEETYADTQYINYQLHFGIDSLVNPERLCAVEIAKYIRNPDRVAVENFARGNIEVQQVKVTPSSKVIGTPLKEVRIGCEVRIGYVTSENTSEVASANTVLEAGDIVTIFGTPDNVLRAKPIFDPETKITAVKVSLFGASQTAISLIRMLNNPRYKIRIFERNKRTCESLAERFPDVTVIHGDATSLRLLEEEHVGDSDYFVASTKDDEENIMTCLQVAKMGVPHVHLVINKPDYESILERLKDILGVELIASPRNATVVELSRTISDKPYVELATLPNQIGKILEIRIPPNSPASGRKVRELSLPGASVIVALLHKFQAKVPGAEDTILGGDKIVAIVKESEMDALLNQFI